MLHKLEKNVYRNENFLKNTLSDNNQTDIVSNEFYGIREIVFKYENEIKDLKEEIEKLRATSKQSNKVDDFSKILRGINRRMDEFSYEPLDRDDFESMFNQLDYLDSKLDKIENSYELRINELQYWFERINHKNVEELKANIALLQPHNPKITLRLFEGELNEIEKIINQKEPEVWNIYTMTLFVMVGVFGMVGLLSYKPFLGLCKSLLSFLGLL